jgi:hypothetical protein
MDDVEAELAMLFQDAVRLAVRARKAFEKAPMVRSQRGADRVSPWFRCWSEATQNAARLARMLEKPRRDQGLDEELNSLLEEEQP